MTIKVATCICSSLILLVMFSIKFIDLLKMLSIPNKIIQRNINIFLPVTVKSGKFHLQDVCVFPQAATAPSALNVSNSSLVSCQSPRPVKTLPSALSSPQLGKLFYDSGCLGWRIQ